eukprot:scaffold21011_cov74-Phaeocystis_antarctica.AAC.2
MDALRIIVLLLEHRAAGQGSTQSFCKSRNRSLAAGARHDDTQDEGQAHATEQRQHAVQHRVASRAHAGFEQRLACVKLAWPRFVARSIRPHVLDELQPYVGLLLGLPHGRNIPIVRHNQHVFSQHVISAIAVGRGWRKSGCCLITPRLVDHM